MKAIQLGMSNVLLVISESELETLRSQYTKPASIALLQGGRDAPGYALMVESDRNHADRLKPGETRPVRLRKPRPKITKNAAGKNGRTATARPLVGKI